MYLILFLNINSYEISMTFILDVKVSRLYAIFGIAIDNTPNVLGLTCSIIVTCLYPIIQMISLLNVDVKLILIFSSILMSRFKLLFVVRYLPFRIEGVLWRFLLKYNLFIFFHHPHKNNKGSLLPIVMDVALTSSLLSCL